MKIKTLTLSIMLCLTLNLFAKPIDSWVKMHSNPGNCKVAFPGQPEHLSQKMPIPEEDLSLQYDVYIAGLDEQVIYMMLVAEYPPLVDQSQVEVGLETFLNGILTQNPSNRLIFADITEVQGHKALDFFIKTKDVYFKGRAIMANNNLYLLAMECDKKDYSDGQFQFFIQSFELSK